MQLNMYRISDFEAVYPDTPDLSPVDDKAVIDPEPLPNPLPGLVAHVLNDDAGQFDHTDDNDRHSKSYHVAAVGRERGLTDGQLKSLLLKHDPTIGRIMQKPQGWFDGEFNRIVAELNKNGVKSNVATITEDAVDRYSAEVAKRVMQLRVDEEARRILRTEKLSKKPIPTFQLLTDLLQKDWPEERDFIERLLGKDEFGLFYAQRKVGKTVLLVNLIKAIVDHELFLGVYEVAPLSGRVGLLNFEMTEQKMTAWLSDIGIKNIDRVAMWNLRGKESTFDLRDENRMSEWVAELRAAEVEFPIWDCLKPVVKALGLSEDKELGLLLYPFRQMCISAGTSGGLVTHHAGWSDAHSIGDSTAEAFADQIWKMTLNEKTDVRSFEARGRDVTEPQTELTWNPLTRGVTIKSDTNAEQAVLDALARNDGIIISTRLLRAEAKGFRGAVLDSAAEALKSKGKISITGTSPKTYKIKESKC